MIQRSLFMAILAGFLGTYTQADDPIALDTFQSEAAKQAVAKFRARVSGLETTMAEHVDEAATQLRKELKDASKKAIDEDNATEHKRLANFLAAGDELGLIAELKSLHNQNASLRRENSELRRSNRTKIHPSAIHWNGHHYLRVDESVSRRIALRHASELGGHLARIQTKAEHEFMAKLINGGASGYYHVDGHDDEIEGTWRFSDGSAISYLPWEAGQPDDERGAWTEDTLSMNSKTGFMHDGNAGYPWAYVIEWDE